jgi:hypothetical protein
MRTDVAYYSYFDSAVNGYLIEAAATDTRALPAIGIATVRLKIRKEAWTFGLSADLRRLRIGTPRLQEQSSRSLDERSTS